MTNKDAHVYGAVATMIIMLILIIIIGILKCQEIKREEKKYIECTARLQDLEKQEVHLQKIREETYIFNDRSCDA